MLFPCVRCGARVPSLLVDRTVTPHIKRKRRVSLWSVGVWVGRFVIWLLLCVSCRGEERKGCGGVHGLIFWLTGRMTRVFPCRIVHSSYMHAGSYVCAGYMWARQAQAHATKLSSAAMYPASSCAETPELARYPMLPKLLLSNPSRVWTSNGSRSCRHYPARLLGCRRSLQAVDA
jgi:hypothetical protein